MERRETPRQQDPTKPRGKCLQIKGGPEDALLTRLDAYAQKIGIPPATAARLLLRAALDRSESK
jgi:hypothetical protein